MQVLTRPLQKAVDATFQNVTPTRLWLQMACICICSLFFFCASMVTITQHAHAIATVGSDAAPSVIAAHQIKTAVETMDNTLADELLYKSGSTEAQEMFEESEKARINLSKQLITAARNITYGRSEEVPIENIQTALGQFLMEAQNARDLHNFGKDTDASTKYLAALRTLQTRLLPGADALDKANENVLEDTFAHEKGASAMSRGLVLVIGIVLVALIGYTHLYVSMRFRRRLIPALLIALTCTIIFLQHLISMLAISSRNLVIAKEDAYNSVVALLDARSNSYDANAAESRALLDTAHAVDYENYFIEKVNSAAHFEKGHDFGETIARARHQLENHEKFNLPGFSGSLADELSNVRFPGEAEAALESLEAFATYISTDRKIRQLETAGNHNEALKLGLGYDPRGSNFSFLKYDDALARTLKINQDQLNLASKEAAQALEGLIPTSLLVTLLIIVCTYIGLSPRLDEYQTHHYAHRRS